MMGYREKYDYWINNDYFFSFKQELAGISEDEKEIEDRFYKELEFGTGGLRGVIAAGTNRMNIYTVRKASQGIADFINSSDWPEGVSGIAIAYDSRRMSREFAMAAACVFAANGIATSIFEELMPTPVLSYTVRHLKCAAGIVITASHNPKEYNGYKVYGKDGGQITDRLAGEISDFIANIKSFSEIKTVDFDAAIRQKTVRWIGEDVLHSYIKEVLALAHDISGAAKAGLKIVYSPLHGTGLKPVKRVLSDAGFADLHLVPEQSMPDGEFSTVRSPNPEEHDALNLAIGLAEKKDADIVIATDPDSDRLGIAVKDGGGKYRLLNGNQIGCLILDFLLQSAKGAGKLSAGNVVIKTIVTTELARAIAADYGITLMEVLTGFKYIGEKIKEMENSGKSFLFGFEESYGYLAGTFVRDKDAVIAALLVCEAAAFQKEKGKTLLDALHAIYVQYGYYKELLINFTFKGKDGVERIRSFMNSLRGACPDSICGYPVTAVRDYLASVRTIKSAEEKIDLPKSDVIYFELQGGHWIAIRPSGTEPKLKVYVGVKGASDSDCDKMLKDIKINIENLVDESGENRK
jgi:phosphoglucomutase